MTLSFFFFLFFFHFLDFLFSDFTFPILIHFLQFLDSGLMMFTPPLLLLILSLLLINFIFVPISVLLLSLFFLIHPFFIIYFCAHNLDFFHFTMNLYYATFLEDPRIKKGQHLDVGQSQEHHQAAHRGITHQPLELTISPIQIKKKNKKKKSS